MKKFLWLIFLLVLGIKVEASEVYYSNYSDYSDYQQEEVLKTDLIDVISEERYLWYKNIKSLGDYQLYNLEDDFSDECYLTDYSDWEDKKVDNPGYIYETRNQYQYTKAKTARYIHLYDLQGSYGAFRITELTVKVNNKEIKYNYTCDGCLPGFDDYINNGISEENMSYIDNGGSLIIDLGKKYPLNQIEVIFYIFDLGPSDKLYTFGYSNDKKDVFIAQNYILDFSDYHWSNAKKEVKKVTDLNIDLTEWTTKEILYEPINDEGIIKTDIIKQYRYREKWCLTYFNNKEYYPKYMNSSIDDYIYRDDESVKTFYSYRTRDRLEIDIFDITNKNFDLNNFIVAATDDVVIKDNIDWNKNGKYEIVFTLNDLKITKSVTLNIASNTISELEKEIFDLKQELLNLQDKVLEQQQFYEEKIKELEIKLTNCQSNNNCLKKTLEQKESIIKNQEKELISLNDKINNLQVKLNNKTDQITYLNQDNQLLKDKINELNSQIEQLKLSTSDLNQEILNEYNNKMIDLINLNSFYRKKIDELREDLKSLNEDTNKNLTDKNRKIFEYEKTISELKTKLQGDCINNLENEKNNNDNLNNKLNDYILKINGHRLFDITLIILLLLFLIYTIYKMQKPKK